MGAPPKPAQGRGTPGARAEDLAAAYLQERGLRLLARNVRCRGGEVDLVALDAGSVVFVEVRLRSHAGFGGAAASIGPAKQRRVILAARHWLAGPGQAWARHPCRFDALLYARLDPQAATWLRGAFAADDGT